MRVILLLIAATATAAAPANWYDAAVRFRDQWQVWAELRQARDQMSPRDRAATVDARERRQFGILAQRWKELDRAAREE